MESQLGKGSTFWFTLPDTVIHGIELSGLGLKVGAGVKAVGRVNAFGGSVLDVVIPGADPGLIKGSKHGCLVPVRPPCEFGVIELRSLGRQVFGHVETGIGADVFGVSAGKKVLVRGHRTERGGHSSGICARLGANGTLIGIDRDTDALHAAEKRLEPYACRKIFVQSNYAQIKEVLADLQIDKIDGALLDLGVSSFQLDNPERGFSYMQEAPLDMRMSQDDSFTAYDVVNDYDAGALRSIITRYGEERWAARIADFIVKARKDKPIETTTELVDIIKAAIPPSARRDGPHPAKRTFQADRIVKESFAWRIHPCTCPKEFPVCVCGKKPDISKKSGKPILPTAEEIEQNPRARSAKLRICEKL